MAESTQPGSVWDDLPEYRRVRQYVESVPNAVERIVAELETEAAWARRDAERRLVCAMALMVLTHRGDRCPGSPGQDPSRDLLLLRRRRSASRRPSSPDARPLRRKR
jgi:hypothetical protein